jgi:hypothetical protein
MNKLARQQKGASAISTIITLAVLAFGVFIAIQYVPQAIESKAIDSILENLESSQAADPVSSTQDASAKVVKMLQINEMNDMTDAFTVERRDGRIVVTFSYDRELNLGYKIQPIHYENTVSLN